MMRMCLSSLPQRPTHFQQSLFLRWFCCWVLVLAGLGSTFGLAVGRAKSPQVQQAPGRIEEKAQESKPQEASQASGESSAVQRELEKALAEFRVQAERVTSSLDSRLSRQQQLFSTRRDLATARYNTITNYLKLKAAAGSLKEEDLDEVNKALQY